MNKFLISVSILAASLALAAEQKPAPATPTKKSEDQSATTEQVAELHDDEGEKEQVEDGQCHVELEGSARGQDSYDRVLLVVEQDGFVEDVAVAAELRDPNRIAEDHHFVLA